MSTGDLAGLLWIATWFAVMWRLRYWDGVLDALIKELRKTLVEK